MLEACHDDVVDGDVHVDERTFSVRLEPFDEP